jgi:hypothetical protein
LGSYLEDGHEAFFVNGLTEQDFLVSLRRAVDAGGETRKKMGVWARKRAEESFDLQCFSKPLGEFIINTEPLSKKGRIAITEAVSR